MTDYYLSCVKSAIEREKKEIEKFTNWIEEKEERIEHIEKELEEKLTDELKALLKELKDLNESKTLTNSCIRNNEKSIKKREKIIFEAEVSKITKDSLKTKDELEKILFVAKQSGDEAADKDFKTEGQYGPCGYVWVDICNIKFTSKLGKLFKAAGYTKNSMRISINGGGQNLLSKEKGAKVAAEILEKHGFEVNVLTLYSD